MRWVVIFEDAPGMRAVRKQYEAGHFAYSMLASLPAIPYE